MLTALLTVFSTSIFAAPDTQPLGEWAPTTLMAPQSPVYINPFTTPNSSRQMSQYKMPVTPNHSVPMVNSSPTYTMPSAMPQQRMPVQQPYQQQRMPAFPRTNQMPFINNGQGFPNSNPMSTMFPSNLGMGNNNTPFAFPNSFPSMPFNSKNGSNPMTGWNKGWGNMGNNVPFMPNTTNSNRKKAWGDKRNIWPDFYTNFTDEAWDEAMGGPRKLGRMPGGWRFPYISTPDPVTVSDAITNQFPPIAEEAGNMVDISKWGVFDGD